VRRMHLLFGGLLLAVLPAALSAQAVPDGSGALDVSSFSRRTPSLESDPFRFALSPHWGFVISANAVGANNALNLTDAGSLILLSRQDSAGQNQLRVADVIDALGLVPRGAGIRGDAQGTGGFFLGGPLGHNVHLSLSLAGRGYGSFFVDDNAVALLRDGNAARQAFSLGDTRGTVLATLEAGAHAVVDLGPLGSRDGVHLLMGFGGRYIRPAFYGQGRSLISNGGLVVVSGDSIYANISVQASRTPVSSFSDLFSSSRGSGFAGDFLLRAEWPTNGLALEAMVANIGQVTVNGVENRTLNFQVATTQLDTVKSRLDSAKFVIQDTTNVTVTLPRIVRFAASAWANHILQLDVAATMPVGGDYATPLRVDLGSTWRFVRPFPLRAGLVLGGSQGIGFTAGFSLETRVLYLDAEGESLGGLFRQAKGAGGRFSLGFFF